MCTIFRKSIANEDGATAIIYGLTAVVAITALQPIGANLSADFQSVAAALR
jgi:Flp pilus assembly pilin Flp